MICSQCGKEIDGKGISIKSEPGKLLCSRRCSGKYFSLRVTVMDRYVSSDGYIIVKHPETGEAIREHRLIMLQHIGRPLGPKEHVHHINGNRQDNRIENLVLFTASEHIKHEYRENGHKRRKRQADPKYKATLFCPICGKKFQKYITNIRSDVVCCSKQCTQDYAATGKREIVKCDVCGKEVSRVLSDVGEHNYCSAACAHSARFQGYTKVSCVVCGKVVDKLTHRVVEHEKKGKQHTCSKDCSGKLGRMKRWGKFPTQ